MSDNGKLEKLIIRAYTQADYSGSSIGEFEAYLNPQEITLAYEMEYDSAQGSGTTNSRMEFKKVKPGDLSLTFFLDGTGANGNRIDVQQKIEQFQTITGYNGDIHRPNYLIVAWGTMQIKRCILKSASIAYKLFQSNGVPQRAIITANFSDNSDDQTRVAIAQDQSPDLTHLRVIKAGDNLPRLCNEIYGDPLYYLEVARANGIDDFRNLPAGTRVFFPPIAK
jgi:hypothetical protein